MREAVFAEEFGGPGIKEALEVEQASSESAEIRPTTFSSGFERHVVALYC